jgi:hypothetical protein
LFLQSKAAAAVMAMLCRHILLGCDAYAHQILPLTGNHEICMKQVQLRCRTQPFVSDTAAVQQLQPLLVSDNAVVTSSGGLSLATTQEQLHHVACAHIIHK